MSFFVLKNKTKKLYYMIEDRYSFRFNKEYSSNDCFNFYDSCCSFNFSPHSLTEYVSQALVFDKASSAENFKFCYSLDDFVVYTVDVFTVFFVEDDFSVIKKFWPKEEDYNKFYLRDVFFCEDKARKKANQEMLKFYIKNENRIENCLKLLENLKPEDLENMSKEEQQFIKKINLKRLNLI